MANSVYEIFNTKFAYMIYKMAEDNEKTKQNKNKGT